nr:GNAT family N-acetyltransferase [uncultured Roseateles sp.]
MQLRLATAADQPWLRALYASTREQELALGGWDAASREAFVEMQFRAQTQAYQARHPGALQHIIECDGQAAGRLWTDEGAQSICLMDISLLPGWQRQGLGTRCLQALLTQAGRQRKGLRLHVACVNPARRLYERLGMVVTGEQGLYLEMTWQPLPCPDSEPLEICNEQA